MTPHPAWVPSSVYVASLALAIFGYLFFLSRDLSLVRSFSRSLALLLFRPLVFSLARSLALSLSRSRSRALSLSRSLALLFSRVLALTLVLALALFHNSLWTRARFLLEIRRFWCRTPSMSTFTKSI